MKTIEECWRDFETQTLSKIEKKALPPGADFAHINILLKAVFYAGFVRCFEATRATGKAIKPLDIAGRIGACRLLEEQWDMEIVEFAKECRAIIGK